MNIYHIERKDESGYDTYSDAVVIAENADEAKKIHPSLYHYDFDKVTRQYATRVKHIPVEYGSDAWMGDDWPNDVEMINVKLIGIAADHFTEETVICASFHAG